MTKLIRFRDVSKDAGFYSSLGFLGLGVLAGIIATYYMADAGHVVTGMSNRIAWGLPHVFAMFLILAATGALTAASIAAVVGRKIYQPVARFSCVVAFALLAGGLSVILLDLGRPDRLMEVLPSLNFKSIFSWNIIVYNGFFLLVAIQLWFFIEPRMNRFAGAAGLVAFLWRILLATDVGSVFGVVVGRQAYESALIAPLFVALSFAIGIAMFLLILVPVYTWTGRSIGHSVVTKLGRLMGIFVAIVLYLIIVQHFTASYGEDRAGFTGFILNGGSSYSVLFWGGQILIGSVIPLALLFGSGNAGQLNRVLLASFLVALGGLAQLYILVIGGQAFPQTLFPGMTISSSAFDGQVAAYTPSLPEFVLGLGGVCLALALVMVAVKVMPVLPMSLADEDIDPHYEPEPEPEPEEAAVGGDEDEGDEEEAADGDEAPQPA